MKIKSGPVSKSLGLDLSTTFLAPKAFPLSKTHNEIWPTSSHNLPNCNTKLKVDKNYKYHVTKTVPRWKI